MVSPRSTFLDRSPPGKDSGVVTDFVQLQLQVPRQPICGVGAVNLVEAPQYVTAYPMIEWRLCPRLHFDVLEPLVGLGMTPSSAQTGPVLFIPSPLILAPPHGRRRGSQDQRTGELRPPLLGCAGRFAGVSLSMHPSVAAR
jgi:hypothetical protein